MGSVSRGGAAGDDHLLGRVVRRLRAGSIPNQPKPRESIGSRGFCTLLRSHRPGLDRWSHSLPARCSIIASAFHLQERRSSSNAGFSQCVLYRLTAQTLRSTSACSFPAGIEGMSFPKTWSVLEGPTGFPHVSWSRCSRRSAGRTGRLIIERSGELELASVGAVAGAECGEQYRWSA